MKKWLYFLFSAIVCYGFIYALNNSFVIKGNAVPAMGKFLNPISGFWSNAEPFIQKPLPNVVSKQLIDEVNVSYDDRMIPHIFAKNILDAYFVQGYIIAQQRLWQMDISTRAASGRLSEVVGEKALNIDKNKRRMGMVYGAENTLKVWEQDKETFKMIEAYTNGVNAFVENLDPKDYPLEFKLLNYAPEKWTPLKSAIFVKAMAETLASGEDDLEATNAMKLVGEETFNFLFPQYDDEISPVIPKDVKWNFANSTQSNNKPSNSIPDHIGYIQNNPVDKRVEGTGSNNWAIGPKKTKNGHPILCGDPHLNLTLPSIWFEMQMQTPEFNAYGVALPCFPGIVIGFNENIAWTQTNVGQDVSDWYTIKWKDQKKEQYLLDGEYKNVSNKVETYNVKGVGVVFDTVKYTKWGPVVYQDTSAWHDMALHWLAHDQPLRNDLKVFYLLNKAKNFDEYSEALKYYFCPAQNFAFACKNGDIAIRVNGVFPIKSKGQGRFVQDGSVSSSDWKGYIPFEQNPYVLNPARGYVSSANQHSTAPTYPYYYNSETFDSYRSKKINSILDTIQNVTMEDMQKLQSYSKSLKTEKSLPQLLNLLDTNNLSTIQNKFYQQLKSWDCNYLNEELSPVLFEKWWKNVYRNTWDEFLKNGKTEVMLNPTEWRTIQLLKENPNNPFFDDKSTSEKVETAKDIVTASFKTMVDSVNTLLVTNPNYKWKNMLNSKINHLTKKESFSRSNFETDGVGAAINSQKSGHGPSWRMVVELGDTVKAWVVYPGGQSGNPGSVHYDDFVQKWAAGTQYEALFMKNPTEKTRILFTQSFKKS